MKDQSKTCLSLFFNAAMFILPGVALAIGWIGWDFKIGLISSFVTFSVFFLSSGLVLTTVKDLSWILVGMPFGFGVIYTLLPDFIPLPFDNALVLSAGSLMTFTLWLKKQPETPKWIIFPLLLASVYTLVGPFIPGPVDELIVTGIGSGVAIYGARQKQLSDEPPIMMIEDNNEEREE